MTEPPQAQPQPLPVAPPLARRMGSWLYEGLLLFAVGIVVTALYLPVVWITGQNNRHVLQALQFVVFGIYFGWCWSHGHTLAMKTWRIRIVDARGQPPSLGRALWRYVLCCCWLWFLPMQMQDVFLRHLSPDWVTVKLNAVLQVLWIVLWMLASRLHPQRQFWHDALAGTRLIDARPPGKISKNS